jgi:hypothetical protein
MVPETMLPPLPRRAEPSDEPARRPATSGAFFAALPAAFVYPFLGIGAPVIFGISFFLMLLPKLVPDRVYFEILTTPILQYAVILVLLLIEAYIVAYVFRIGQESSQGEEKPPALPDFSEFADQIAAPAVLYFVTWLACFFPYAAYMLSKIGRLEALDPRALFVLLHGLSVTWPVDAVGWILRLIGLVYFPMAMMLVMVQGSPAGLNPQAVGRAVPRVPLEYAVVVGFVALKFVFFEYFVEWTGLRRASAELAMMVIVALVLYLLMVQGRLLGLLYWTNRRRLREMTE